MTSVRTHSHYCLAYQLYESVRTANKLGTCFQYEKIKDVLSISFCPSSITSFDWILLGYRSNEISNIRNSNK
jgi:hypothetical protein